MAASLLALSAWPASANAPGATQDFTIVNKTGHDLVAFNVSAASENEWGPDILGEDTLPDGETGTISFNRESDECLWDLRATYDDEETSVMKNVNLCEIATVTLTP
jgi:hypothetical protein